MVSFDKASGVVYTETTSARVGSMVPTWMFQARGKRSKKSTLRSRGKSCSSLQEMALRSCAFHAELFEPTTLQWAGWHYAGRIYLHLINTEALTYNAWNVFASAYPIDINPRQEFHIYQGDESYEPTQLFSIISRLAKLNTSFITFLCVRDFSLTFDHLKALTNVPTLAALVLEQARPGGRSEITARNFHDFGRAVREKGAFQKLRMMVLCDFGIGRKAILQCVGSFPTLQLIGLQNSKTGSMDDTQHDSCRDWSFMTPEQLENRGLTAAQFDPLSIWTASYLTSSSKMQQLYHLADSLSSSVVGNDRSVSLTYGGWANRSIYEATAWFIRDLSPQSLTSKEVECKTQVTGNAPKKRKIRTGKNMDLGSLLGAFK